MADVFVDMTGEGEPSSKCREARRRRIEMRRITSTIGDGTTPIASGTKREPDPSSSDPLLAVHKRPRSLESDPTPSSAAAASSSSSSGGGEGEGGGGTEVPPAATSSSCPDQDPLTNRVLGFGFVAVSGRSRDMEDAVSVRPDFFKPAGRPPLHFFAVFDGHGGSHVSALCRERMHVLLAEELERVGAAEIGEAAVEAAVRLSFRRMDELALGSCCCGQAGCGSTCGCDRSGLGSDIVGSTAVVAVVGRERVMVANCGDSRAVLSRGGRAVAMSEDHKPHRPDELARIEAAGGRVIYQNGARVNGILAMSRALGDKYLKPVVICEPEILVMDRHPQDECLILASDGLWDVLPNDMACDVALQCLGEGNLQRTTEDSSGRALESMTNSEGEDEHPSEARCNLAASLLARLALGRRSSDNISVIVVDLRRRE